MQIPNNSGLGGAQGKFGLNSGFNSTKVRTQRFGVTSGLSSQNQNMTGLTAATSPNYNVIGNYNHFSTGLNTTNNANYQHKQRQLSYSPNMQAAKGANQGQNKKKRNISESAMGGAVSNLMSHGIDPIHINQVPSRRSQSKNDKYKDQQDITNGMAFLNNFSQPGGKTTVNGLN